MEEMRQAVVDITSPCFHGKAVEYQCTFSFTFIFQYSSNFLIKMTLIKIVDSKLKKNNNFLR